MTATIEERVARGAAFLDVARPGWRDDITPAALSLASGCKCILGQIFGDVARRDESGYSHAVLEFGRGSEEWAIERGFQAAPDLALEDKLYWKAAVAEYAELELEWYRAIGVPELPGDLVAA